MADTRRRRRQGGGERPVEHTYAGLAVQRAHEARAARDAGRPAAEVEALALEALGFFYREISDFLPAADSTVALRNRSGWLRGLRRLASVNILDGDLAGLALAVAELDRGTQDPSLVAKGKSLAISSQGAAASTDKMKARALAVQAFDLFLDRKPFSSASKAFDHIEVEAQVRGVAFSRRTLAKWRADLAAAPAELRATYALRFRSDTKGGPIDALELLLEAYSHALSI